MSASLVLRPSGMSKDPRRRWALQLRWYVGPEVEYATLTRVTDSTAQDILDAGPVYMLFGKPDDWKAELDQLEPEAMRPEELVAEVHRLRALVRTGASNV